MKSTTLNGKLHRSWLVCLGGGLALFTSMGLGMNIYSTYQPYIIALNNFTNAQGSLVTTVRSFFSILAMLATSWLVKKFGLRGTMVAGMICSVLAYVVFGLATTFPAYCVGGALSGLSYAMAGMIPLSFAISRWFDVRRGFALGLAASSTGVATIIAPTFVTQSIQARGLSATFFSEAVIMVVLTLLVVALVRNSPQELGLTPYGYGTEVNTATHSQKIPPISPAHWRMMLAASFLAGAPVGAGFAHLTVLYSTEGFSPDQITLLFSYLGVVLMFGKVVYGQISDVLGGYRSNYLIFGVTILGMSLCCLAPLGSMALAFLAMTGVALSLSLSSITQSIWVCELVSTREYEGRVRLLNVAFMLGNLSFSASPGILADITGSYVPAVAIFGGLSVVALVLIQLVYRQLKA